MDTFLTTIISSLTVINVFKSLQNGGTCIGLYASYCNRCDCQTGYIGTRCEHHTGRLRVYARYARNLPDEDGWWNNSDPYIEL